jgi:hypothetical protein
MIEFITGNIIENILLHAHAHTITIAYTHTYPYTDTMNIVVIIKQLYYRVNIL